MNLAAELGCSPTLAEILVRRGYDAPAAARAFLDADLSDVPAATGLGGMEDATATILGHVAARRRIVVHGDYDCDGVCATAVLVRCLRRLGADVSWYLPSRERDGYGLAGATVERLAAAGTALIVTVDCAITAVEEVALARQLGVDVVVTDHHTPRADGQLPDAPMAHPRLGDWPCPDLCGTAVAHRVAEALEDAAGAPRGSRDDLDLVAIATVADCVSLHGENRALVRAGLRAVAGTGKPGLRALMRVSGCDPGELRARSLSFALAPRINAAGRMGRADAALELLLTEDEDRADAIAQELHGLNAARRDVETKMLFSAEAQVAAQGDRPAYVLAGENWHRGVVGIVASRIAERHNRPAVLIALDGATGVGSGRSIPAYDLLSGLNACADHLERHGGHRAAAGLEIATDRIDAFRAAFEAHAAAALSPEDRAGVERVDAVVGGDAVTLELAEELGRLEPFGEGNPAVSLLMPAAALSDARPMGEGKHVRFTVAAGGARARAVAFGCGGQIPVDRGDGAADGPVDATFELERNAYNGAVEARLRLRSAQPSDPPPIAVVGEPEEPLPLALAQLDAELPVATASPQPDDPATELARPPARTIVDRRGTGLAGTLGGLVASGESVLVVCVDVPARLGGLRDRLGGFTLCSWDAFVADPALAGTFDHVVALDPPPTPAAHAALHVPGGIGPAHLAWGEPELRFVEHVIARDHDLRPAATALYRALREAGGRSEGAALADLVGSAPRAAGRALRVLRDVGLLAVSGDAVVLAPPQPSDLERSEAFRAYRAYLKASRQWLSETTPRAA
jgi:single-stranded-DNA-specific exonuclease